MVLAVVSNFLVLREDLQGPSHESHTAQHLFLCLLIFHLKFFHLLIKNLYFGWLMLIHFVVFTNSEHRRAIGLGSAKKVVRLFLEVSKNKSFKILPNQGGIVFWKSFKKTSGLYWVSCSE